MSNCPPWKPDGRVGIAQVIDHGMQEMINEVIYRQMIDIYRVDVLTQKKNYVFVCSI